MGNFGRIRLLWLAGAIGILAASAVPASAQDAPEADDQQRAVARISLINGEVSVRRGDAGEWVAGVVNAPLLSDDRISTGPNSRAEIEFDASNIIRIGGNAEVNLAQLEYGRYQLQVAHGTVSFIVLRPSSANVEVDTPNVSVRPSKQGTYRITVTEAGETEIIARAGEVEVFTPRGSQWVNTGKMMMARGNASDPEFQIVNAPQLDEWDQWNQMRDRSMQQSASYQYVPQGVYGAEDLDTYGSWTDVAPYGHVWRPRVAVADWAPYRNGRWVWEDWYGWTWVSYDPWGWAPYHYGRWFWDTGAGWCWYPGLVGRHHYWSPALVAWFGFGGGGGFGFGFGNVGWVPLAPYEVFHPWWGRNYYGRGFNRGINITNINVTNVYRNARFGNGISGVGYTDFNNGRFNSISRFSGAQVRQAGLIRGQMPIGPSRSHLQFTDRAASYVPRNGGANRQFFSTQRAASVQRVPFEQQRQAFERGGNAAAGGGNFTRGGSAPSGGTFRGGAENTRPPAAQQNRGGGWQSFGTPSRQGGGAAAQMAPGGQVDNGRRFGSNSAPAPSDRPQQQQNRASWGRFGEPGGSPRQAAPASPRSNFEGGSQAYSGQSYGRGGGSVVRERPSAPQYSAPRYSAPSAPQYSAPRYSAPSAPQYSAPSRPSGGGGYSGPRGGGSYQPPSRSSGGGGGYSAPRSSGGGGGSAPRGGGGGGGSRPSGGGGGNARSSSGGGHRGR